MLQKLKRLVGPGDLAVTVDYRDMLGGALVKHMQTPSATEAFPDYEPVTTGVIKD